LGVRAKIVKNASKVLNTPEDELEIDDGEVRVADIPSKSIKLSQLAAVANPTRGTVEPGMEPGLEATAFYGPPHGATGQGAVGMVVEVDPDTFNVKINRYVIVHDCGTGINPMVVEGQVQGGVSMGIGNSFFEQMVYDENGQLLNATLSDYLLPRATDMPWMELGHVSTPSPLNPLGIKGVGEAGAIPTPAAFIQALENALADYHVEIMEAPLNPSKLYGLVQKAKEKK